MRASSEGFVDVVKALLEAKADLNTINEVWHCRNNTIAGMSYSHSVCISQDGETAIFFAARNGHVNIVNVLAENGAAVDHKNKVA